MPECKVLWSNAQDHGSATGSDLPGRVDGSGVNNDDFAVAMVLSADRVKELMQVALFVVRPYDDRSLRQSVRLHKAVGSQEFATACKIGRRFLCKCLMCRLAYSSSRA